MPWSHGVNQDLQGLSLQGCCLLIAALLLEHAGLKASDQGIATLLGLYQQCKTSSSKHQPWMLKSNNHSVGSKSCTNIKSIVSSYHHYLQCFFSASQLGILVIVNPSLWHLRVTKLWAATNVSTLPRPKVRRRTSKVSCWKQMASACLPCHQSNSLWSKINALCIHFTQEQEHLDDS